MIPENKEPSRRSALSLVELADHLGLSKSTVSRALSGTGRIAAGTRELVRQEAQRLGYQADPLMSAFSRHRRKASGFRGMVVALILPGRDSFVPNLDNAWAERLGYHVEKFYLEDYRDCQATLARVLRSRGMTAAIFPEANRPIRLDSGAWRGFYAVYCGPYPGDHCPFDTVRHNPFDTVSLAYERAAQAGLRRIGLVLGHAPDSMTRSEQKTLGGYRIAQQLAGKGHAKLRPLEGSGQKILEDQKLVATWLQTEKPDCVLGFVRVVQDALRRISDEAAALPFIALRMPPHDWDTKGAAGFRVGRLVIERLALRHLDSLIRSGDRLEKGPSRISVVVEPEWVPGESFPERS